MIFVGGYARTGTTLIGNYLCTDPRTNPPMSEVAYLEYLMFPYQAMINGKDSNHWRLFDDLDEFFEFHRSLYQKFFDHLKAKHQCEILVMKRPFLTVWFPVLANMFEEAKFVVCIRDPRDVIGSLKRVKKKHHALPLNQQDLNPFLDLTLLDFTHGYVKGIKECVEAQKEWPDKFFFVKYEEVVTNPQESFKTIGEALGLVIDLESSDWENQQWKIENPYHSKGWGQPITTANIGNYKSQLNEEEVEMVELVAASVMEVFGYE